LPKYQQRPSKPPSFRKRFSRMSRAQASFSILALLVVCSLVATTVGTAIYDDLRNSNSNDPQTVDSSSSSDPVLEKMRADVQASPNDPAALAGLANYLANTGSADEAIVWYEKAIALKPDGYTMRLDFALALSKGQKYADAEVQFKKVITAVPNYAQAYLSLGQLYLNWIPPRDADAIAAFNSAISIDPTSVVADRAREELSRLVGATPAASPSAPPAATP
jgi:tetratricopeptide (TPR) repeat protein